MFSEHYEWLDSYICTVCSQGFHGLKINICRCLYRHLHIHILHISQYQIKCIFALIKQFETQILFLWDFWLSRYFNCTYNVVIVSVTTQSCCKFK